MSEMLGPMWIDPADDAVDEGFTIALVKAVQFVEARFGEMFFQGKAPPLSSLGASMMGHGAIVAGANGSTLEQEIAIIRSAADKLVEKVTKGWVAATDAQNTAEKVFDQLMDGSLKALADGRTIDSFVSLVEAVPSRMGQRKTVKVPDGHVPILAYRRFEDGPGGAMQPNAMMVNAIDVLATENMDESRAVLILLTKYEHVPYVLTVVMEDTPERRDFVERCFSRAQRNAEAAEGRAVH